MDSVGGMLDAFSQGAICSMPNLDGTCHRVDVIADLVSGRIRFEDLKKERQVVLEEIKWILDNPISPSRNFHSRFWPQHSWAPDSRHAGTVKA